MSVANPVLYIPVESQNWELDSKLLIAGAVATAGVKVVLGWQRAIEEFREPATGNCPSERAQQNPV